MTKTYRSLLLFAVLLVSIAAPRFYANDRTVTVDEWTWMNFSANFYYALGQREFEHTYQDHHPGVPTMIAGATAIHLKFPEYRGLGQGYFTEAALKLIEFFDRYGVDKLGMLVAARQVMVTFVTLTLLAAYYFARRLLGTIPAFLGIIFIALDPYHVGHSRLLTHEGLMSALLILAFFSFMVYLYEGGGWWALVTSGAAGGLALSTKITALPLFPFFGLVAFIYVLENKKDRHADQPEKGSAWLKKFAFPLLVWALVAAAVFTVIWPAMWVAPGENLAKVFGLGTALFTNTESVSAGSTPIFQELAEGFAIYGKSLLARSTPLTWVGVILALGGIAFREKLGLDARLTRTGLYLFLFAVLYFTGLGMIASKRAAHYILSSHAFLDVMAGLGFAGAAAWVQGEWSEKRTAWAFAIGAILIAVDLATGLAQSFPYYFVYLNPIWGRQQSQVGLGGYGGLLDQAAAYLAEKPDAEDLTVMSWYGPASFSFFFPGETLPLWPVPRWSDVEIQRLRQSDYLVIYHSQFSRNLPPRLIAQLEGVVPEHIVEFNGLKYVYIYKVSDLPAEAFEPDPAYTK